jgi:hypothetical protein
MRRMRSTTLHEPPEYKPSWIFWWGSLPVSGVGRPRPPGSFPRRTGSVERDKGYSRDDG